MTPDDTLALARQHQQAGRSREAEALYRQALEEHPDRVDLLDSLAQLAFQSGNQAVAGELLRRAIAISPHSVHLYTNLGVTLASQRQFDEAIALFRHALTLKPHAPEILTNLAATLKEMGSLDEAIACFRQAISFQPDYADAHYKLAGSLKDKGDLEAAIAAYRQTLALRPDSVQAHNDLANCLYLTGRFGEAIAEYQRTMSLRPDYPDAHNNLCISLHEVGRLDDAAAAARRAIALRPDFPEAHYNLGRVLEDQDRCDEATAEYERALQLRPGYAEARNNLALMLEDKGDLDEAIAQYHQTLATRPDYTDARVNLGVALKNSGRLDEAVAVYNQVLATAPGNDEARWNLAISLLLKGDFERAWPAYEARRNIKKICSVRDFPQPQWSGQPLAPGQDRILLHAEQGFGDTIQLIRYVPLVRRLGGRVIVLCYEGLRRLFTNQLGIEQVVSDRDPLPAFDVHCPFLSLPGVFRTTLQTIPATVPYLRADEKLVAEFEARMAAQSEFRSTDLEIRNKSEIQTGNDSNPSLEHSTLSPSNLFRISGFGFRASDSLRVGLVWAGSRVHIKDHHRSLPLSAFAPLAQARGIHFFSLQKGHPAGEAKTPPAGLELVDWTSDLTDFADTAALIANLDLVISADTAVAHLAGAMAKPVWVLLPFAPDWRWMLHRTALPWYPTMRLFRQSRGGIGRDR